MAVRLRELDDETLRALFAACWEDTKAAFCHEFNISAGQFSRWSNAKKESRASADAVRRFLAQVASTGRIGLRASLLADHCAAPPPPSVDVPFEFLADWARVEERVLLQSPQIVAFLDGDQAAEQVKRLTWLLPSEVAVGQTPWGVHILVTGGQQTKMPRWWPARASWCSWVRAPSHLKEAADLVISLEVERLHRSLSRSTRFLVVSEDRFAATLAELFAGCGRTCRAVSPSTVDLGLFLVLTDADGIALSPAARELRHWLFGSDRSPLAPAAAAPHVTPELIQQTCAGLYPQRTVIEMAHPALRELKQLLHSRPLLPLSLIGQRFPWMPDMTVELTCSGWHKLLHRSEVLGFLGAELRELGPAGSVLVRCSAEDRP